MVNTVVATYLSEIMPELVQWYWRGRLAKRKLTCFDGLPGMGKTTVGLDIMARFTRGDVLPGEHKPVPKTRVAFLSDEDGIADTTIPRLHLAGADLAMICQLTGTNEHGGKRSLSIPADIHEISQIVRSEGIGYLHIDPLAAHASKGVDLYVDQDVRAQIMFPLANLAEETDATIVLVRHPTKAQLGPAMLRGGGSMGIIGAARFGLMFGHDPHNETARVIASTKCNIGPMPQSLIFTLNGVAGSDHARVTWDPNPSDLTADDLLPTPSKPTAKAMNAAESWLLDYLDQGPRPADEALAAGEAADHKERTLRRAKATLQIVSKKETGFSGGWYWCLPGQEPPADKEASASMPGFNTYGRNGVDNDAEMDHWAS